MIAALLTNEHARVALGRPVEKTWASQVQYFIVDRELAQAPFQGVRFARSPERRARC